MNAVVRYGLAIAAATIGLLALANAAVHHAAMWIVVAAYAALAFGVAVFERGRYRPRLPAAPAWRATGERFFDPVTGAVTDVFYDPASGARDYRTG